MKKMKLAIVGFGVVGQGLACLLVEKKKELKKRYGVDFSVVAISDFQKGSILRPGGIDLERALQAVAKGESLEALPARRKGLDALETIEKAGADIVVEATYTDLETGGPAIDHLKKAFACGCHVATTNKGPVALAYERLSRAAQRAGVQWRFEGTVMSGTPVISLAREALAGAEIRAVKGILNGTTNYMLCEMEKGNDYESVLRKAQRLGYAEADPTGDVEGHDAMGKVVILARTVMGIPLKPSDVSCKGITRITPAQIEKARKAGKKYKLIASVEKKQDGSVKAAVRPVQVKASSFLGSIDGPRNAVTFVTDTLGEVCITGPGAGRVETGFSLLSDLIAIARLS